MPDRPGHFHRHRFPAEVIRYGVWLYHRFALSFRDVEELLLERGIIVTYETIRAWVDKFGERFAAELRRRTPRPGRTWHLDEVFLKIRGEQLYLWRAVDENGQVGIRSRNGKIGRQAVADSDTRGLSPPKPRAVQGAVSAASALPPHSCRCVSGPQGWRTACTAACALIVPSVPLMSQHTTRTPGHSSTHRSGAGGTPRG